MNIKTNLDIYLSLVYQHLIKNKRKRKMDTVYQPVVYNLINSINICNNGHFEIEENKIKDFYSTYDKKGYIETLEIVGDDFKYYIVSENLFKEECKDKIYNMLCNINGDEMDEMSEDEIEELIEEEFYKGLNDDYLEELDILRITIYPSQNDYYLRLI